ncbi:hypothetical protein [Sphingomonas sp. 3-13AW]|uniref:hypothetical protein n=1 Tax=Sphingomonas sp. 3-13AW TaxID=3050450 RepID=UPI003BB7C999
MHLMQRSALDPDFVYDASRAALDERLVCRISMIRQAVDANFGLPRRNLVGGIAQLFAFAGADAEEAVRIARGFDDQLQGSEEDVSHVVGDTLIEIVAGEPPDELTDTTIIMINAEAVATAYNQRETLVEVDADWDALDELAHNTVLA